MITVEIRLLLAGVLWLLLAGYCVGCVCRQRWPPPTPQAEGPIGFVAIVTFFLAAFVSVVCVLCTLFFQEI